MYLKQTKRRERKPSTNSVVISLPWRNLLKWKTYPDGNHLRLWGCVSILALDCNYCTLATTVRCLTKLRRNAQLTAAKMASSDLDVILFIPTIIKTREKRKRKGSGICISLDDPIVSSISLLIQIWYTSFYGLEWTINLIPLKQLTHFEKKNLWTIVC